MATTAVKTGDKYVRYERGGRKWYRAILEIGFARMRVSRKRFKRAREAVEYRDKVMGRMGQR